MAKNIKLKKLTPQQARQVASVFFDFVIGRRNKGNLMLTLAVVLDSKAEARRWIDHLARK